MRQKLELLSWQSSFAFDWCMFGASPFRHSRVLYAITGMLTLYVLTLTALSGTAVRAGNMVLVLYAVKLGSSAFVIGLLGAMFAVLPMLFSMPAGKLADRYGSRALLLFCVAGSGLGLLVPWAFSRTTAMFVAAGLIGALPSVGGPPQNILGP